MNTGNTILVTGGAGFIGSNFVLEWLKEKGSPVINLDILSYSGNLNNLKSIEKDERHTFIKGERRNGYIARGMRYVQHV